MTVIARRARRRPTSRPTNPAVLKRALDTGGRSLIDGARNFVDDMLHNNGRPRQVDTAPFEVGRQPGRDPGEGGLPQRADRDPAVPAADRAGARGAAAVQSTVDQQVLRDGPGAGAQLHRVGGPARPYRVRDQLPQPGRVDGAHHDGRLPDQRATGRSRRGLRDHRRGEGRPGRALPRRRADR